MEEKELLEKELESASQEAAEEKAPVTEDSIGNPAEVAPADDVEAPAEGAAESEEKPMSKKKRIINAVLLGVQIALVVIALVITMVVIFNPRKNELASFGLKFLPVQSDSMDGSRKDSFKKGDLVIAVSPKNGGEDLAVDDIVTFEDWDMNGTKFLNTHRIVRVEMIDGVKKYVTQGDNPAAPEDSRWKLPGEIKAVYVTHIKGLGNALDWIREPGSGHIIYVIIIPLAVLLIYNIYLVAQILIESKVKKARALAAENAKQAALASIDEEEIKRRAIEEYLKSQGMATASDGDSEKKGDTK